MPKISIENKISEIAILDSIIQKFEKIRHLRNGIFYDQTWFGFNHKVLNLVGIIKDKDIKEFKDSGREIRAEAFGYPRTVIALCSEIEKEFGCVINIDFISDFAE